MKILCLLALLLGSAVTQAEDVLTLYLLPSPEELDWKTPHSLLRTGLYSRLKDSARLLGQVYVELQCGQSSELVSVAPSNLDPVRQLVIEERGLGILFHSFEGKLEEKKDLEPELKELLAEGKVNFTRFLLNQGHCQRLTRYLKEFREHKVERHFGLALRPRYGEGANPAVFGVSFLEVADVMDEEMKDHWGNEVKVPLKFAGPPVTDERIGLFSLLFSAREWARDTEAHRSLFFWDTNRMHGQVKEMLKGSLPERMKKLELGKAQGIIMDVRARPAPEGPIWLQHSDPTFKKK